MRVAITGGTGYVGTALRRALAARGDEAVVVRRGRRDEPGADWDPGAGWFRPGALEGFDAVVHLSGASIGAKRWTAARRAELRASRVDSTRVLVEHLGTLSQRPKALVTASATGYYGNSGAVDRDESGPKGEGFLADLVADWEAEGDRAAAHGVRVVHARFSPTVARDSELIRRVLLPFTLGLGGPLGSGRQWFSWVATEDVVRALLFLLDREEMAGPVNVTAPHPVTNLVFTRALGRALHRPTVLPVPATALRLLFGRPLTDEALLSDLRAIPARLTAAGFEFAYPTIEGAIEAAFEGERAGRAA